MPVTMLTLHAAGPDDTRGIAAAVAELLTAGDIVALSGELGAGKTCFVQGAATALGVEARVTSPTFVLMRSYTGRLPLVHCDVYRLDRLQDVYDLGDEVLAEDVVTFVEWGDAIAPLLPSDRLEVEITRGSEPVEKRDGDEGDAERTVVLRVLGPSWTRRLHDLATACAPWR